jgi:hypothetical protein
MSFGVKQMGARNAGNPHVACDVAGLSDHPSEPRVHFWHVRWSRTQDWYTEPRWADKKCLILLELLELGGNPFLSNLH